jgi:hypothetical protein
MQYFVQESFIITVDKLAKNNSYEDCEKAIIENVFKVSSDSLFAMCSAMRLNASPKSPIAKLRVNFNKGKSSSYRMYVFALVKNEEIYFAHIYPKAGTKNQDALSSKEEKSIIKKLLENYKEKQFSEVYLNKDTNKICFISSQENVFK